LQIKQDIEHGSQISNYSPYGLWIIVFERLNFVDPEKNCGWADFGLNLCGSTDLPTPIHPPLLPLLLVTKETSIQISTFGCD